MATLVAAVLALAAAAAAVAAGAVASTTPISAVNGDGEPVDWWYVLKLPEVVLREADATQPTREHCGCAAPHCDAVAGGQEQEQRGAGLCYVYADSRTPTLMHFSELGYDCLGQGGRDPLSATLKQMVGSDQHWAVWNDELDGIAVRRNTSHPHKCSASNGFSAHSKGALCYNDKSGGFYLQTSTPNFPDPSLGGNGKFVKLGCQHSNNVKFSQHFFAMTLGAQQLEELGASLQAARLCSANQFRDIADLIVSPSLLKSHSAMARALADPSLEVTPSVSTVVHTKFSSIAVNVIVKSEMNDVPPWALVAHSLASDVSVASWWDAAYGIPSICHGDGFFHAKEKFCLVDPSVGMSLSPAGISSYNVENLSFASWLFPSGKRYNWNLVGGVVAGNHAKFGIGSPRNRAGSALVIFGDMNMEGFPCSDACNGSQGGRGGVFFSISDASLWQSMKDDLIVAKGVCSCQAHLGGRSSFLDSRLCGFGCTKKLQKFEDISLPLLNGDSRSFWDTDSEYCTSVTSEYCHNS